MESQTILQAVIREAECIGCTKCIEACPFDAILGARKEMHTVIASECIGCKLCVAPCPVDCIDMVQVVIEKNKTFSRERAVLAKKRYHARQNRLKKNTESLLSAASENDKKAYIQAALLRVKNKK